MARNIPPPTALPSTLLQDDIEFLTNPVEGPSNSLSKLEMGKTSEAEVTVEELDPSSPRNWHPVRKWTGLMIVSFYTVITPISASILSPALTDIADDLSIKNTAESKMALSIFVLAFGFGPLIFGPLSETFGRAPILRTASTIYLVFNLGCALAKTKVQLFIFRFLAGFGGSGPQVIGMGVIHDLFTAEQRGVALAMYSTCPLMGPAIGPICGAYLTQYASWRWSLGVMCIACAVIQIVGLFLLPETYEPVVIAKRSRKDEPGGRLMRYKKSFFIAIRAIIPATRRPIHLLLRHPIIQVCALLQAFGYGIFFFILSAFSQVWTERYGESLSTSGLNYFSLAIGFLIGAQVCGRLSYKVYRYFDKRLGPENNRPETRLVLSLPGSILAGAGLLLFGWTSQYRAFWFLPDLGVSIFAAGFISLEQSTWLYIIDVYQGYSASAMASCIVLRSIFGFVMPLIASPLTRVLGLGWENTTWALISLVLGIGGFWLLWVFGVKMRASVRQDTSWTK